jgi:hypothetical protein
MNLQLAPTGSLRGRVTVNGKPAGRLAVLIAPTSGAQHIVMVQSDSDGAFQARRVAQGPTKVSAMKGMMGGNMTSKVVEVRSGQSERIQIDIHEGTVNLTVKLKDAAGQHPNAAQAFLFPGSVAPKTGGEVNQIFLGSASDAKMTFAATGEAAIFQNVPAARYSLCVIPIYGDMSDPAFAEKLQNNADNIPVYCQPIAVAETPDEQSVDFALPEPVPLPEGD